MTGGAPRSRARANTSGGLRGGRAEIGTQSDRSRPQILLRVGYSAVILIATLSGLALDLDLARIATRFRGALFPAFSSGDLIDGLRNAALFAGLGVVWVATSARRATGRAIFEAVRFALALSASIEILQTLSPDRDATIVDIVTDTLGALGGAVAMIALFRAVHRSRGRKSYLGLPAWLLAGGYAGAVAAEATSPLFRQRILQLDGLNPLARAAAAMSQATLLPSSPVIWADLTLDALLFAPAGAIGVMALREFGTSESRAMLWVAAAGMLAASAGEVTHGISGIEIVPLAVPAHAIGIGIGAVAAARLGKPSGIYPSLPALRLLLMAYAAMLVIWAARPFVPRLDGAQFIEQLGFRHLVPMLSLASRKDLYSVMHVFRQFLLFVPLGAFLAVWPLRRHGRLARLLPALYFAVLLELTHLAVAARHFDTTNIVLSCAGAGLGWLLVRGAGFRTRAELYRLNRDAA